MASIEEINRTLNILDYKKKMSPYFIVLAVIQQNLKI